MKSILLLLLCAAPLPVLFAQSAPVAEITQPTKPIVTTPFDQPTPPTRKGPINGWQAGIGEWWVQDGVLHGDEVAEDHHAASCTYRLEATDLLITAEFKLGKSGHVAFGCRDTIAPNHHLGRTFITPESIWIQKMSGIAKTTRSEKLTELKVPIDPEAWQTLTIEISNDRYLARIGQHRLEARHQRFKDAKGIVALIVKGQGAQFRNVALWHASPKSQPAK